jgi:GNAT superfamily N-acetyltransferase
MVEISAPVDTFAPYTAVRRARRLARVLTPVRRAADADLDALSETLALAFEEYPWTNWTVAADHHLDRLRGLYRLYAQADGLPFGEIWVTDGCESVAVWMPPGHRGPSDDALDRLASAIARLFGDRLEAAHEAEAVIRALRPEIPHWYLASMGTRPELQGQGLGSEVLAPVLARCDADNLPAYCDTSTERNVRFYARHGFAVVAETDVPGGGPHVWLLGRQPRQGS